MIYKNELSRWRLSYEVRSEKSGTQAFALGNSTCDGDRLLLSDTFSSGNIEQLAEYALALPDQRGGASSFDYMVDVRQTGKTDDVAAYYGVFLVPCDRNCYFCLNLRDSRRIPNRVLLKLYETRTDQKGILSPALCDTACPGRGFFRLHELAGMVASAVRHGIHALVLSCLRVAACSHGHMAGLRQTGAPGQPVVVSRLALVLLLFVDRPCIHVRSRFLNALFARFPLHKPSLRAERLSVMCREGRVARLILAGRSLGDNARLSRAT